MLLMVASGYRNLTSGALTNVGTEGGCLSSSPSAAGSVTASGPWFNSGNVNPFNSHNRGHGIPVRCVQYLQAAFFNE
ncbi:MAG: hypothetical protein K2I32_02255 [Alistipes sp.]|nr:hypothetical protein [Alistipes sp.]